MIRNFHKSENAFSLLELIVVMSIVGVMVYVLFSGITNFRREILVSSAAKELFFEIQSVRREAINNVLINTPSQGLINPDLYLDCINDSKVQRGYVLPGIYNGKEILNLKTKYSVFVDTGSSVNCVIFKKVNGEISFGNGNPTNFSPNTTVQVVNFVVKNIADSCSATNKCRSIEVNRVQRTIKLKIN